MSFDTTTVIALYGALLASVVFGWEFFRYVKSRKRKLLVEFAPMFFTPLDQNSEPSGSFTVKVTSVAETPLYVEEPYFQFKALQAKHGSVITLNKQLTPRQSYQTTGPNIDSWVMMTGHAENPIKFPFRLEYGQTVTVAYEVPSELIQKSLSGKSTRFEAIVHDSLGKGYKSESVVVTLQNQKRSG